MKKLLEPQDSLLTIKYRPNGEGLEENPPRFTWMPASDEDLTYKLQISKGKDFNEEDTISYSGIPYNFFTPDGILEPGVYHWRYSLDLEEEYTYSSVRSFTVTEDLYQTPIKSGEDRFRDVDMTHPRIWMNQGQIDEFREALKRDPDHCGFQKFYEKSIKPYDGKPLVKEPAAYPDNKRVVHLWRKNYSDCQDALTHIRSLAVGGIILEDEKLLSQAKTALLELTDWDVNGTTSRDYNDECSFRVAYALAFGYDWLYGTLTQEEKKQVLDSLYIRTKQVADHVIVNSRIHFSLYDSHAVRSLSSVLTPCCTAMLGDYKEAEDWLNYTINYFNTIYTPWGGADGGWAEGPMYWTTGMAFLIDALNTIKSFTGINLYQRPFFQKTGDFILYCNPADTYRACFCDQSNMGKYPGHKTACNMRQFAGVTGNKNYQDYYEEVFLREPEIDPDFFNSGWWDFNYDDMVYAHDYKDAELSAETPLAKVRWFRDIGWTAINRDFKDKENHLLFLTKSSPYGSVSHSHGDQNSFLLFAYGEPLLINSGYYIGFNTSMHRNWRRQTKSQNNILINGQGQYAGMDKAKQLTAKGQICEVMEQENLVYIKENATLAYLEQVPSLKDYTREIYFIDDTYFVIVDSIETSEKASLDWLLHSMNQFEVNEHKFSVKRGNAELDGRFVYCSSGIESISQNDEFEGVDLGEIEGLSNQWHLTMKTKSASNHVIVTLLTPSKVNEKQVVNAIKDDQGMDIYFYFSCDGKTFSLRTDGNKRY